jgi:hypothetical protein
MSRFELEEYPQRFLPLKLTRRELFGSLRFEFERRAAKDPGPAYKLTALGAFPDDELAEIVPALVPGSRLSITDGVVWAVSRPNAPPRRLFAAERANLVVIEAIDGHSSLGAIAETLRGDSAGLADRSFAHVRSLFLELVLAHVAAPT